MVRADSVPAATAATRTGGIGALLRLGAPLLLIAAALDGSLGFYLIVMQTFLPQEFNANAGAAGFALAIFGATRVLLQVPGGMLARRTGAWRLALLGLALGAAALAAMGAAQSTVQIYLLTAAYGGATAIVWPALYLLAADETAGERGALLGLVTVAATLGQLVGLAIGAVLTGSIDLRVLVPLGATVLAGGALLTLGRKDRHITAARTAASAPSSKPRADIRRVLVLLLPLLVLQGAGVAMVLPLLRPYAIGRIGVTDARLLLLFAPGVLVALVTFLPWSRLSDRIGRAPVAAAGCALGAVGTLVLALATSQPMAAIGAIPLLAGYAAAGPALGAWISDLADDAGRNVGLGLAAQGVGYAVGPALTGYLLTQAAANRPMAVASAVWLAAAALAVIALLRQRSAKRAPSVGG